MLFVIIGYWTNPNWIYRELQWRAKKRRTDKIDEVCINGLKLILSFLDSTRDGIDPHQLVL